MKKLLLSLLICMGITMITTQSYAQDAPGEKLQPYVGGTYTYTFDGITDGLTYEFYISELSTSNFGKGIDTGPTGLTGYISSATTGIVGTDTPTGTAVATIEWPSIHTPNVEVFLFVKITGTGVCENYKAVGITPIANTITLALLDDIASPSCPTLTTATGFNALVAPTDSYNPGTTTLSYTFTKTGNDNDWNLGFNIVQVGTGDYTYTIGSTSATITTDDVTTPINLTELDNNTQQLTIVVKNVPGDTPSFQIVPLTATDDVTSITIPNPSPVTHVITPMPVIGGFN